jgi:hypothetical protein
MFARASSSTAPKATPRPPGTRPTGGSGSQQQESAGSGAGGPPLAAAQTVPVASHAPAGGGGPAAAVPTSGGVAAIEEVPAGRSAPASHIAPTRDVGGDTGGASSSKPPPAPEEMEVVFGRQLRLGAEEEAAPIPLPRMLFRAHQVLSDTGAAILREWEALEAEHQCLSDWRTQLEERTRAASCQFISERSQLERDCKEYKKDLQKVYARELEAHLREKKVARREEIVFQREALATEFRAKLNALDQTLEEQRVQQTKAVERLQKLKQELEGKASVAALAEEKLKVKEQSLDRRETDLAMLETDLTFREEMLTRRGEMLAEHELGAEKKEKELEERIRQFQAAQAALGPQTVEVTRKALEDLQAEHHARVQRIAAWAGEASTTLVPLGMSPIPVSELPTSISDALPVLDSVANRLRCLDHILSACLEVEGGKLCRVVIEYVLTCFRSHDPAISLEPVIAGPVPDIEDAAREGI